MTRPQNVAAALSINGFLEVYPIGRTKAYEEIKAGRLKAKKVGKRTLILKSDAEAWAAALPAVAGRD